MMTENIYFTANTDSNTMMIERRIIKATYTGYTHTTVYLTSHVTKQLPCRAGAATSTKKAY